MTPGSQSLVLVADAEDEFAAGVFVVVAVVTGGGDPAFVELIGEVQRLEGHREIVVDRRKRRSRR